jgi:hypothetical protein
MNLTNFLKQTDELMAQCSREQLISFIHDTGRVLPESRREDFLNRLRETGVQQMLDDTTDAEFDKWYERVRENLMEIDSQEKGITSELNEAYDEWYDNDCEEVVYEDEDGVSDLLAEACDFVHTCMDGEKYKEGFSIGRQLFAMKISCFGDWGNEDFTIGDMVYHELLDCDINKVLLDALYCAYHAVSRKKRPEKLYEMIEDVKSSEVTLENIMQHGDEELPDFQEFLTDWITYVGNCTGHHADRLFSEAVDLLNDIDTACEYAQKFVDVHPGLYLDILNDKKCSDGKKKVQIGVKAMQVMPKKYVMRSKVALKTAKYVIQIKGQLSLLEKCYFIAYVSDTSALNYLRVLLHGYETEERREELRMVYRKFPVQNSRSSYGMYRGNLLSEREENKPESSEIFMLKFFDGQFDEVLQKGLNVTAALGWTGTFMKQGIALFLLGLYEGKWSGSGMAAMENLVKNAMGYSEEYQKEMGINSFYQLFSQWKSVVGMESEFKERAIKKITALMEWRTEGIMEANRRNYYGECASYIAALGEVMESYGDEGAKQRLMTSYKNKYTRRSAFRAEMRSYGWIDGR